MKWTGENNIDEYLYKTYLKNTKNGFYIECGAANGVEQSNTAALNAFYGWGGLLVEANPFQYRNILKNRARCWVVNCALVSHEYKEEYIEGFFDADPDCLKKFFTTKEEAKLAGINFYKDKGAIKEFKDAMSGQIKTNNNYDKERFPDPTKALEVPAKTLDWVLGSHGIKKADFFSLDVDGYEREVLKGWSPSKYPITYVLIEGNKGTPHMKQNNYTLIEKIDHNLLFKKNN